jgi:transposase
MRRRADLPPVGPQSWTALIPPDSFYARLAEQRDVLVADEPYSVLYKDSRRGRPSIPPSVVVLAMLLQYHDDCSDAEAEQRVRFDLRWKHALGLDLEDVGFDATVLCRFRRKLLDQRLERVLFERLVNAAREAGLIAKNAAQVVDSSHVLGAAGVRDTYALLRGGIRKLLRALGYTGGQRTELPERLAWYVDPTQPEKPDLDWTDPQARAQHLREIVADARAVLALVPTDDPEGLSPVVAEAAGLLTKIVADDVEEGPPPAPKRRGRPRQHPVGTPPSEGQPMPAAELGPRLRQGVAPDRLVSVVDPEMRWGHKSRQQRWPGYKIHIAEELTSELLTIVQTRPANEHDAEPLVAMLDRQEERVGLRPDEVLSDGAYGTADVRAALGERGIEVVARLRPLTDTEHFSKEEFTIDLAAHDGQGSVTCPVGVTASDYRMARDTQDRPVRLYRFPRAVCAACSLRERCLGGPSGRVAHPVRQPPGRQVQLHFHEAVLQQARAAQRTPEQKRALRERLRPRAKVERKLAELLRRHGLRQGGYLGRLKTDLQAVLTGTMVNAKRLLALAAGDRPIARALRHALATG